MYPAYKLNQQGDNIQVWRTPFPIWNQSVVPCPVLVGLLKENWSFQGFNFYYLEQDLRKSIVTRPFEDRRLIFLSLINLSKIWLLFRYTWLWETSAKGKKKKKTMWKVRKPSGIRRRLKSSRTLFPRKARNEGVWQREKWEPWYWITPSAPPPYQSAQMTGRTQRHKLDPISSHTLHKCRVLRGYGKGHFKDNFINKLCPIFI